MGNIYRSHTCGELNEKNIGGEVALSGWAESVRDHGGVVFIDLRDHYGVTQVVTNDDSLLHNLSKESVCTVRGAVERRDPSTVNKKIPTGAVEVRINELKILSAASKQLPFEISASHQTREDLRLMYRYLDLRNPAVHGRMVLRSNVISFLRRKMESMGFLEIHTPILTASSPEGARDYLVPSRKHKGKFYALPQAPQQFKQLLMVSGFDRYFQIAPCFRDEDARGDRSPGEFYQLDFEMAFAEQDDVFAVAEEVMTETFSHFAPGKTVSPAPFARVPYAECMKKYGTDKPDLRNPLLIEDLTDFFTGVDFAPFQNKTVRGITAPACASRSRTFFETMLKFATDMGMQGLGYISVTGGMELKGPIVKFLSIEKQSELINKLRLKEDDTLFFIADTEKLANRYAGGIRGELGARLGLIDGSRFEFCFVTDFPMYERDEETREVVFTHNPFSMPQGGLEALRSKDPLSILAHQYDIVCNGVELSSGAVRNYSPEILNEAFGLAGYAKADIEAKFSALYEAFHYGAPPHAGMAPGIERIVMLLAEAENIREVVPFPMNGNAQDLMMNAPGEVTEKQLREAHIKVR
ncbi:MAG: aspartate--tRNA ligase [Defluviitaleaceae bacterium]|nr:aspartate--tRNA ligase [Defluviitaleaceae bacterium]